MRSRSTSYYGGKKLILQLQKIRDFRFPFFWPFESLRFQRKIFQGGRPSRNETPLVIAEERCPNIEKASFRFLLNVLQLLELTHIFDQPLVICQHKNYRPHRSHGSILYQTQDTGWLEVVVVTGTRNKNDPGEWDGTVHVPSQDVVICNFILRLLHLLKSITLDVL